jgi:hypothetical protein
MSDLGGYDPDEDTPPAPEDKAAKDAEARANRLEAQNRKQEKELQELREYVGQAKAEKRQNEVAGAMTEAGLPAGLASAWIAMNPDAEITPESVTEFASTLGLTPKEDKPSESKNTPPQPQGSTPPVEWHNPQSSGTTTLQAPKMSFKELDQLMRTNPMAAREALKEGRVEMDVEQVGVGEGGQPIWGLPLKGKISG